MRRRPWGVALLVLGGIATGVAVAGVPSRGEDPPLRVQTDDTVTTIPTVTSAPTSSTTTVASAPTTTSTVRRR